MTLWGLPRRIRCSSRKLVGNILGCLAGLALVRARCASKYSGSLLRFGSPLILLDALVL
jgi:hypothetical protein